MSNYFERARLNMVANQVMINRVFDKKIEAAMRKVEKHYFLEEKDHPIAYSDTEIKMSSNRKLLKPELLGQLIEALSIQSRARVLDIGCCSGYSTAILAEISGYVTGVESDKALSLTAADLLIKLGYDNVSIKHGALAEGAQDEAPYHAILINGKLTHFPLTLFLQLKKGGRIAFVQHNKDAPPQAVVYENNHASPILVESWRADADFLL